MNLTIISGSSRQQSASENVSKHLLKLVADIAPSVNGEILSLATTSLPMWDENTDLAPFATIKQQLSEADGFVFVVPEWHGMVPPAVKNLFFLFSGVFRHKPAYLVTVSSGTGGRYPILV